MLKIVHWSDLHIRLASRHDEYKLVLDRFANKVKEEDPDYIVFTGDLFHNKVHLSPESYEVAKYIFDKLVKIAPNILITGNHDQNLAGQYRQDAITPFVELFNDGKPSDEKLIYWKDSGIWNLGTEQFFVYPMIVSDELPDESKIELDKTNIALYHGIIGGSKTNSGWEFNKEDQKISIPNEKFDAVLLGDIHKVQKLTDNMAYAGSLIQQDWGEHPKKHGYLTWEFDENGLKDVKAHKVKNDYGKYLVEHKNGEFDSKYDSFPPKATVKVIYETEDIQSDVKEKFVNTYGDLENVSYEEEGMNVEGNIINVKQDIVNLHNFENQQETIREYFEDDDDLEELVKLNEELFEQNKNEFDQDVSRTIFDIGYMEFSNTFAYGEDNKFVFSDKDGIIGFFSPNRSGKSSFLDTIAFAIFGETPHTSTYDDIINWNKDSYRTYITLQTPNRRFSIERSGKRSGDSWRNNLTLTEYDSNGNVIMEESDMREAKGLIEKLFGDAKTYEKTAYIYQDNEERFLNLTPARRKEWLYNNLGLEVFEILHQSAKEKSKDLKNKVEYLKSADIKQNLNEARIAKGELAEDQEEIQEKIDKIEENIRECDEKIETLRDKKHAIDDSLEDQSDDIERAKQTIEAQKEKIEELGHFDREDVEVPQRLINKLENQKSKVEGLQNDDGKLEEEKKKQNKLEEVLQDGKETKDEIEEYEDTLNTISDDIESIEIDDLDQKIENLEEKVQQGFEIDGEINSVKNTIERFEEESSVLKEDERFENEELCQTCPLLEDARKKKEQLPEFKNELKELEKQKEEIDDKEEKLQELQNIQDEIVTLKDEYHDVSGELDILRNQRENLMNQYKSLKEDLEDLEKRRNEIKQEKIQNAKNAVEKVEDEIEDYKDDKVAEVEQKVKDKKHKVEKLESNVESLQDQQQKWEKQQKLIKENEEIDEKIEDVKNNKSAYESRKNSKDDDLIEIKSRIQSVDDKIEKLKNEYEELKELKEEYKVYTKYIEATHKDQIPLQIITSMLDVIQAELNNVISQITDFRLKLFVEDDNVECNIVDERGERTANRLSGMERFTCNLAFRIAIAQIGNMAVPNFLIVDEGFSAIDSTNSQELPDLFSYLNQKFSFIMVVSHHEQMRDLVNYNVEINSDGKFAQLSE